VVVQELEITDYLDWTTQPAEGEELESIRRTVATGLARRLARFRREGMLAAAPADGTNCDYYFDACLSRADDWLKQELDVWSDRFNRDRYRFVYPVLRAVHSSRHVRSGRYIPPLDLEQKITRFIMIRLQGGQWAKSRPDDEDEVDRRGLQAIRDAFINLKLPPVPHRLFRLKDLNRVSHIQFAGGSSST